MSSTGTATEQPQEYRPSRPGSGVLGSHPMRERIVEAILDGQTSVAIYRWVSPKVSRVTISELARVVKEQHHAALILDKAKKLQSVVDQGDENTNAVKEFTKAAVMGGEHLARIRAHQNRIDRNLVLAEADGDRDSLATLIKADLQGVRLAAELDGSLQGFNVTQSVTNNILVLPFHTPSVQPTPAIETTAEQIDD